MSEAAAAAALPPTQVTPADVPTFTPNAQVRVIRVEHRGPVEKMTDVRHNPWRLPVWWILDDGRRLEYRERFERKREAVARIAELPAVPACKTYACFNDKGEFDGWRAHLFA